MAGQAGACQPPRTGTILNQLRARIDSPCSRRTTKWLRPEDLAFPQKKKGQPLSQDGWLFFFVPIEAEILSVLKEAG